MPFKSEAQRKYLWANEPGIARDWTDKHGSRIAKALGGRMGFDEGGMTNEDLAAIDKASAAAENIVSQGGSQQDYIDRYNQMVRSHGGTPEKTIKEKIIERVDNSRQKSIDSFVHRNKKKNLNKALDYGLIDILKGRGIDDDEVDYFDVDDIRNLYAGGADPKGLAGLRKDLEFEEKFKDTKPTQTQFEEYYGLNKPPDTGGGGEEEIPWWLRQQAPVESTPIKEEVASNGLGEGHFLVPLDYVKGGVRAAEGGRIGLFEGGGMTNEDLAAIEAHAKTVENIVSPGGSQQDYENRYNQMVQSHGGTPNRPPPTNQGGGIQNINYGGINLPKKPSTFANLKDFAKAIWAGPPPTDDDDTSVTEDKRSDLQKTISTIANPESLLGKAATAVDPNIASDVYGGLTRQEYLDSINKAQGGRIGYQEGNRVGGGIMDTVNQGPEMESAMMQSEKAIKELYEALIAQGLSPEEAMERVKQIIAGAQAEETEEPRTFAAFGGIMDTATGRRGYLGGSFFKAPKKLLKKAVKTVKKIAKSDLGRIALWYAAGTYLAGTTAFGGTGELTFAQRLKDPRILANLINPTGSGIGEGKGWSMFQKPAAKVAEGATGYVSTGHTMRGDELFKKALTKTVPDVAKSDWSKWILPASIGAGLYTAKQPLGDLDDSTSEWDEKKAKFDKHLANLDTYEGDFKVPDKYVLAQGGRIGAQEGGLMNLGGMEKDYRQEGGFVPIGGEEKADDVPARLSKNEFVFTADAVRAAGGGDIDAGAEVMENVMQNLEAGGKISEESQGEGAQGMFEVSERLSEVM